MSVEISGIFNVYSDVEHHQQMVNKYGFEVGRQKTLERLAGNFKFQAWEVTEIPLSDTFYYKKKVLGQSPKLVFEGDEGEELDIEEVTDFSVREGLEGKAVREWKRTLLEMPVGAMAFQFNPKATLEELQNGTCRYPKGQLNVVTRLNEKTYENYQVQGDIDHIQGGLLLNKLTSKLLASPEFSVGEVMTTIGINQRSYSQQEVLSIVLAVEGRAPVSINEIKDQKQYIVNASRQAALDYLLMIESIPEEDDLKKHHAYMLGRCLPREVIAELVAGNKFGHLETSCGPIFLGGGVLSRLYSSSEKWIYQNGNCVGCGRINVEVGPCKICKSCEKTPQFDTLILQGVN